MYFSVFTPNQLNCPSNSSASLFMIKSLSQLYQLWKSMLISLRILNFKLHKLCAAPLYSIYNYNGL